MARPIRSALEKATQKVPEGPLGFAGEGNGTGAALFAVSEVIGFFIPGSTLDPGFRIQSHSIDEVRGKEVHTFRVSAYFEQTARFSSQFNSAPSNIDFFIRDIDVTSVEKVEDRATVGTWEIVVEVQNGSET